MVEVRYWDYSCADRGEAQAKLDAAEVALTSSWRRQEYLDGVLKRFPNNALVLRRRAEGAEMVINRHAHVEHWRKVLA